VRATGYAQLIEPRIAPPFAQFLRVWVENLGRPCSSMLWAVYTNGRMDDLSTNALVRRLTHRGVLWCGTPKELKSKDGVVPIKRFQELMHEGAELLVQMVAEKGYGIVDGSVWGIEIVSSEFGELKLSCHGPGPKEWAPLVAWVKRIRNFLMRCFTNTNRSESV
jgi:hypothetical protein